MSTSASTRGSALWGWRVRCPALYPVRYICNKGEAGRAGQIAYIDSILSRLVMCMIQSKSKSRGVMVRQGGTTGGCEERLVYEGGGGAKPGKKVQEANGSRQIYRATVDEEAGLLPRAFSWSNGSLFAATGTAPSSGT